MNLTLRIFLIVLTVLIAISIGLLLRRLLVHRLKNSVLDNWIVQTLGILIILPPLIVAAPVVLFILSGGTLSTMWDILMAVLPVRPADLISLAWSLIETVLVIALGVGIARTLMKIAVRGLGENHTQRRSCAGSRRHQLGHAIRGCYARPRTHRPHAGTQAAGQG